MTRGRIMAGTLGALLAFLLVFGSSVHALIPHEHSDHHGAHEGESVIWQSLHASLRHEDKKAVPIFDALVALGSVALLVAMVRLPRRALVRIVDDSFDALRRGVFAYRRFG